MDKDCLLRNSYESLKVGDIVLGSKGYCYLVIQPPPDCKVKFSNSFGTIAVDANTYNFDKYTWQHMKYQKVGHNDID